LAKRGTLTAGNWKVIAAGPIYMNIIEITPANGVWKG